MAQQTSVSLVDDLDGGKAAETVTFGLDGSSFEIDLSKRSATALRTALTEFVEHGRQVTARVRGQAEPEASCSAHRSHACGGSRMGGHPGHHRVAPRPGGCRRGGSV